MANVVRPKQNAWATPLIKPTTHYPPETKQGNDSPSASSATIHDNEDEDGFVPVRRISKPVSISRNQTNTNAVANVSGKMEIKSKLRATAPAWNGPTMRVDLNAEEQVRAFEASKQAWEAARVKKLSEEDESMTRRNWSAPGNVREQPSSLTLAGTSVEDAHRNMLDNLDAFPSLPSIVQKAAVTALSASLNGRPSSSVDVEPVQTLVREESTKEVSMTVNAKELGGITGGKLDDFGVHDSKQDDMEAKKMMEQRIHLEDRLNAVEKHFADVDKETLMTVTTPSEDDFVYVDSTAKEAHRDFEIATLIHDADSTMSTGDHTVIAVGDVDTSEVSVDAGSPASGAFEKLGLESNGTPQKEQEMFTMDNGDAPELVKTQSSLQNPLEMMPQRPAHRGPRASDFNIIREVGTGSFGRVMLIQSKKTAERLAMKILEKERIVERKNERYVMEERDILTRVSHPFIVSLHYAFQSKKKLYLVMEYLPGGELLKKIRAEGLLNDKQAMFYAGEIVLALDYLHSRNIVHRDLKPENILLDVEGHIRLTDFGLARKLDGENALLQSICGTDLYMAPEMLAGKAYGKAVDFWALGCLIYEMQTGDPPFDAASRKRLYQMIMTKNAKFPSWMSASCNKLLKGLLDRNVEKRLGAARSTMFELGGVAALKQHEFFKKLDWALLEKKQLVPPLVPDIDAPGPLDGLSREESLLDGGGSECSAEDFRGFSYVHPSFAYSPRLPSSASKFVLVDQMIIGSIPMQPIGTTVAEAAPE